MNISVLTVEYALLWPEYEFCEGKSCYVLVAITLLPPIRPSVWLKTGIK